MVKATVLLIILALAGCAARLTPIFDARQIWCDTHRPRRDATPATPRSVLDEINTNNRIGAAWCGWKP